MSLKKATLLAIIGICYVFVSRTVGTLIPGLFRNLSAAQANALLSFLASLTLVAFFVLFYRDYVQKEQLKLKKASVLAIIGASLTSLLHMKGLLFVFDPNRFPYPVGPRFVEPILPWVSSILILFFFVTFYRETLHEERMKLRKATLFAVIGSSVTTLLRTFLLFNYLFYRQIRWFSDLSTELIIAFTPVIAFSFFAGLYFFLCFYKEQKVLARFNNR